MAIVLYWFLLSQPSRALKAMLDDSGIEYSDRHLDLQKGETRTPEILKLNPAGTVPFITVDGQPMTETIAIMRYLTRAYPQQLGHLYPKSDLKKRYLIDKWGDFYTDSLRPAFASNIRPFLTAAAQKRDLNEKDHIVIA